MIQQQLYEWITHPERLNRDTLYELRTLLARYPYFQTVRLLYLKNLFLLHDITFGGELRKAALYVADRKILFYLIEGERFTVSSFEKQDLPKEEAGLDRTLSLIDTFLSSLPEEPVVMELPMDVTTDYTSFLLHEEEHVSDDIPQMKGQNLIDNFIELLTLNQNKENVFITYWINCACSSFDVLCRTDSELKRWRLGF